MISLTKKLLIASPVPPIVDTSPDGGQTFLTDSSSGSQSVNTYSYTVPENVTYISAVAIGGGGRGGDTDRFGFQRAAGAGGGGAVAWSNKIPVTPGEILTITVGNRSLSLPANSSIKRGDTVLLLAAGGSNGNTNVGVSPISGGGLGGQASDSIGQARYSGGNGGTGTEFTVVGDTSPYRRGPGGGGAAGYAGPGGQGARLGSGSTAPAGGGGGGGATGGLNGGVGGGVGVYGLGQSGVGGIYGFNGTGDIEGDIGSAIDGGTHNFLRSGGNQGIDYDTGPGGGGGGARYTSSVNQSGNLGQSGAVRIIHGTNQTYPINSITNNIIFVASTSSSVSTIVMPSNIQVGDLFLLFDLADYNSDQFIGALPDTRVPVGWTAFGTTVNFTTYTMFSQSMLVATAQNIGSLPNSTITGHGGTGYKSKVILQFRPDKTLAVYRDTNRSQVSLEIASAPATVAITGSAFPYSNGMAIVTAFFRGDNPIVAGSTVSHTGANYIEGAAGTNTIVSYKIYNQSNNSYSSTISMSDVGTNTRATLMLMGY